ncbi:MAG: branched-chain amino acid ABC transporter permease, partial [Spirochaetales bacterium]
VLVQVLTSVFKAGFYLTQITMSAYLALAALGLCILMGYSGQISLGQAGFFAIGGYTSASLTTLNLLEAHGGQAVRVLEKLKFLSRSIDLYGKETLHVSPWAACIMAIIITVVIAYVIGRPILTLKGHYLAMATLGFGIIIYRIVLGSRFFGEADGLHNVPAFSLVGGLAVSGDFAERLKNYYIAWFFVVIGMLLLINLVNSRAGRALRSIHGSEEASRAMGINTARFKLSAFIMGAVFASVAGIFLTHYNGGIGPGESSVMKSVRYVAIVAVGGMANLWGTLIMGVLLNFLSLRGVFGSYDDAVFGIILIAVMLFAPEGILGFKPADMLASLRGAVARKSEGRNAGNNAAGSRGDRS